MAKNDTWVEAEETLRQPPSFQRVFRLRSLAKRLTCATTAPQLRLLARVQAAAFQFQDARSSLWHAADGALEGEDLPWMEAMGEQLRRERALPMDALDQLELRLELEAGSAAGIETARDWIRMSRPPEKAAPILAAWDALGIGSEDALLQNLVDVPPVWASSPEEAAPSHAEGSFRARRAELTARLAALRRDHPRAPPKVIDRVPARWAPAMEASLKSTGGHLDKRLLLRLGPEHRSVVHRGASLLGRVLSGARTGLEESR